MRARQLAIRRLCTLEVGRIVGRPYLTGLNTQDIRVGRVPINLGGIKANNQCAVNDNHKSGHVAKFS
jgi:hypothetical protein